ncbi:putative repeat protein (TIGR03833 family) [Bacillus chungangensis]|uniref:Repeat protein (TIGR03833 family) n=2 Tax=Bacillus chungangensis TaxID=587633 RepID=A0ABT9WVI5_9BACI|nr:putative repeat protein (TIGR03833 family) [Bacillus chungangensis]
MSIMKGQYRKDIQTGTEVEIVLKKDQRTGKTVRGHVKDILTNTSFHPHGVKVRLEDGRIGRVKRIVSTGREE